MTGAVHHYKQVLRMRPDYTEAYQRLHIPACFLKGYTKIEYTHEVRKCFGDQTVQPLRRFNPSDGSTPQTVQPQTVQPPDSSTPQTVQPLRQFNPSDSSTPQTV